MPEVSRHSLAILGAGPVLGSAYNAWLDHFAAASQGGIDWQKLWMVQAAIGLAAALIIAIAFRPGLNEQTT